ncbi:MAG: hypothetical protein DHS20C01_15640 [marine bacterium B5-7]|nr:MAG: hypothetical protein DHS20C01_15640 [marine bacterium B5-7]
MRIGWTDEHAHDHLIDAQAIDTTSIFDDHRVESRIDSLDKQIDSVSLWPGPGYDAFQILSLDVDIDSADSSRSIRRIGNNGDDIGVLTFDGIRHFQIGGFSYFLPEDEQACIRLRLGDHLHRKGEVYRVRVRMLVLDSSYVASFRSHLLSEMRRLEERNAELEREFAKSQQTIERVTQLERQLEVIRSSRVWRFAEGFRRLFYHRFLGRFPGLRSRALDASRRRVRQQFSGDKVNTASSNELAVLGVLAGNSLKLDSRDDAYQVLVDHWEAIRPNDEAIAKAISEFAIKPLISIVMPVFDTPVDWLRQAIDSVLAQRYDNFELCLVDDCSTTPATLEYLANLEHPQIVKMKLDVNSHISAATNHGIQNARGDYIAFLDHDDLIDVDALYHVCVGVNQLDPDVIYTDEDYIDDSGHRFRPNFKPDFSPDLLLSHNYITHLLVVKRILIDEVGGFDPAYDGAQDYDFVIRLSEIAGSILHIPKVLYHWRQSNHSSSTHVAAKPYVQERTRALLKSATERRGIEADILNANLPHFFYTRRRFSGTPSVSIIVPFRDEPTLLETCLNNVLKKSTYNEYEIIGVNNQSESALTFELMEAYRANPRVRFIDYDQPFNFSTIINRGAAEARGEYLVFLNNDIEIITWQWIEELLCQAAQQGIGVVGGKLFYPDNTVQHAGIVVGIDGYAGHTHKRIACHAQGYGNRLQLVSNVSAVTGAFMMVGRELFHSVGGFDEVEFPVACNDVDFCLRVMDAGYWNVFTPYAQAYHLESASRGYEMTEEKRKRFQREKERFVERHASFLELGDPFYNRNLSLDNESFMIRTPIAMDEVE